MVIVRCVVLSIRSSQVFDRKLAHVVISFLPVRDKFRSCSFYIITLHISPSPLLHDIPPMIFIADFVRFEPTDYKRRRHPLPLIYFSLLHKFSP